MTRPSMRQRRSPGLLVLALALGLFALHAAFVGVRPHAGALRERHVRRAKDDDEDDSLSEFFIEDVSPVGRRVVKVYRQLKAMKGEQEDEVAKIMDALAPEQKKMLNSVLIARQSQDRPIETSKPENGDSPERLYKKLQMLKDDSEVVQWRLGIDPQLLQSIQDVIEKEQMKLADAEMAKEAELSDAAEAAEAWRLFQEQFPKAAAKEVYMTTPCREADIKFRFRRMKEAMEVESSTALEMLGRDSTPMFVDPDFVRRTWKAMVEVTGREDALESIVLKHPGSLVTQPQNVEAKINEIKTGAAVIGAFADVGKSLQGMFR